MAKSMPWPGGTDAHNQIAGNLYELLRASLRGSGCRTYFADVKARIEVLNLFYYPDVIVTCDDRDLTSNKVKRHPCLNEDAQSALIGGANQGEGSP